MPEAGIPVLIVGGGPAGLSASLLLSRQGVRSLLVERHPATSVHPKARGLNVRTMELFRVWGLEAAVRAAAQELERARDVVWAPALTARETRRVRYGGAGERLAADSPAADAACAQDKLEPVLLEAARSYGLGEVRFARELRALTQNPAGVEAVIADGVTGREMMVRAVYVIAADGAQSPVRSMLGIGMAGPGVLAHRMGIYFRADLARAVAGRPALMYWVGPAEAPAGVLAAVNLADLWLYMVPFRPEDGERAADFTQDRCIRLVRAATGVNDLEVEILSALPWQMAAATAGRFRQGRVFLAGDAAHLIPPAGGQAMNVGIQDVHNLAWKMAGCLSGWAGTGLLDSYQTERRPVAVAVTGDAARNVAAGSGGRRPEQFSNRGRVLGITYDSSAVIPDGTSLPTVANPVTDYVPAARPGSRAPHIWLWRGGQRISALDLYDTSFVLLAGRSGLAWCEAGEKTARLLGIPLACYVVGPEGPLTDPTGAWPELYGVGADGAVLVRPDGHVAWRAGRVADDPASQLAAAFRRVLSRG
jgi:putative polyketide hydroxylase